MKMPNNSQNGFTLIELLVVLGILGVLSGISIQTYKEYKARAAYAVADKTLRDARTALSAAMTEPDVVYAPVSTSQNAQGALTDGPAYALLSPLRLPRSVRFDVYHEPGCIDASCVKDSMEVHHCIGLQYVAWTQFGDGVEVLQQRVDGAGC